MKRFFITLSLLAAISSLTTAQSDSVTLMQCLVAARTHALIRPQIETTNEISELNKSNKNATNFPSFSAYGKAWYQNDAITVTTPAGTFLEIDRFQYNLGIEAVQKLYDGGIARRGKNLDEALRETQINKIETELYQLNDQVVEFFFRSSLLGKNKEIMELKKSILQKRWKELESAYENDMISRNEVEKLHVELLSTNQQLMEIEKYQSQTLSALEILTGMDFDPNIKFIVTDSIAQLTITTRPEHSYFNAESLKLEKMASLNSAKNLPKLYAYGQTGYSYPGLNFFENQSDYYYIVGARLSWTIFDWQQTQRNAQIIHKQKEIVDSKRNDFNEKLKMSANKEQIEQEKLINLINMDRQIIAQRILITSGSASALKNGAITTASYLEDLNAEIIARIGLETHKIQYQNSLVRLYLLNGIDLHGFKKTEEYK